MKSCVVIPARYASSRFAGKPLVPLLNKPMVIWVAEISARAVGLDHVYIATDDDNIANIVNEYGYQSIKTSSDALTGTDRVAEAATKIDYDIYINVQGDEPTINPREILKCIKKKEENFDSIINGYCEISKSLNPSSTNIPKVVKTESDKLLYMSALIPGHKDIANSPQVYLKQVCIYAFNYEELKLFRGFGRKSLLEQSEDIEILRFLDLERNVLMFKCENESLAVDVPEDVVAVENYLKLFK